MTPDHSRRNFFGYVSGAFLLIAAVRNADALPTHLNKLLNNWHPMAVAASGAIRIAADNHPAPLSMAEITNQPTISGPYDRRKRQRTAC